MSNRSRLSVCVTGTHRHGGTGVWRFWQWLSSFQDQHKSNCLRIRCLKSVRLLASNRFPLLFNFFSSIFLIIHHTNMMLSKVACVWRGVSMCTATKAPDIVLKATPVNTTWSYTCTCHLCSVMFHIMSLALERWLTMLKHTLEWLYAGFVWFRVNNQSLINYRSSSGQYFTAGSVWQRRYRWKVVSSWRGLKNLSSY